MQSIKELFKESKFIVKMYELAVESLKRLRIQFRKMTVKKKFSYGNKNRDKTFFVIPVLPNCGLYSSILLSAPIVEYALEKGFYPVFDYKNYFNPLLQDEEQKGLGNAWEYYYEQPCGVSLEEVYQSKNVIKYHELIHKTPIYHWNRMVPTSDDQLQYWHRFIVDNFRLQQELRKQVEEIKEQYFPKEGKILGVGIRAGFRAWEMLKKPVVEGHPKVPSCEEMITLVEAKMRDWGCEYLFIHSDDREYREKFENYFGERCIAIERHLWHYFENDVPIETTEEMMIECKDFTIREQQEEYIKEIYLLGECTSLYTCRGGGAVFSYFLNGGKYEYAETYDEGYIRVKH